MDKQLDLDARKMMSLFPSGWSMRASDLQHYFPSSSEYRMKVFHRMIELATGQKVSK